MSNLESPSSTTLSGPRQSNIVALVGAVICGLAVVLCVLLFWQLSQLPDDIEEFQQLRTETPTQLRLFILACCIAVLAIVAFCLCVIGLLLPQRDRLLATIGSVVSFAMLTGVFGVAIVGVMMNPAQEALETPLPQTDDE